MSLEELSIGNELKDSFKATSKWISNGNNWLTDIEEFYRERAAIEKDYAFKLNELCKKHFDKKAKQSSHLSVGDEPQVTPGSLECASLVLWTDVLTQTEKIANEKVSFSKEINAKVADNIVSLKNKSIRIAKQIEAINEYLVLEKQKVEDEVNKAKKNYDTLCQSTENAREKVEKSASEKYQRKLEEKTVEMNVGKNDYLIKINIANRLKDKYYYQDVPEILDYFQEANENRVGLLNKLVKNALIIERNLNDRIKEKLHQIDSTIDQNNPKLDTAMYIKHNMTEWKEPGDFYFIPSSIWHDDESLVVKEPELTTLKRRLAVCSNEYSKVEQACLDSKQKLEEATVDRKKDEETLTLKYDAKLMTGLSVLQTFMKHDTNRVRTEVEIETIQNFAGSKDLTYVPERKVLKSKFGFLKGKKKDDADDAQSVHTVKSSSSHHTFHSGLFNLRGSKAQSSGSGGTVGRALYAYEANGDDEISMSPGDEFNILEEDDGSGWTSILLQGASGLVPSSYVEIIQSSPAQSIPTPIAEQDTGNGKKTGPSVAPKRGAKRVQYVEALYDYEAEGDDELSIRAGDRMVLIQDDTDGSGWTEGELNGERGMFPTSYVKKV